MEGRCSRRLLAADARAEAEVVELAGKDQRRLGDGEVDVVKIGVVGECHVAADRQLGAARAEVRAAVHRGVEHRAVYGVGAVCRRERGRA